MHVQKRELYSALLQSVVKISPSPLREVSLRFIKVVEDRADCRGEGRKWWV
jgi:hypothetical protein